MIDFSETTIAQISHSLVGNATRYEGVSKSDRAIISPDVEWHLIKVLQKTFMGMERELDFGDKNLQVKDFINDILEQSDIDIETFSILSKYLYESSGQTPKFKQGEFLGILLKNVLYGGEFKEALVLLKIQEKQTFLQLQDLVISQELGIPAKLEVAAVILLIGSDNVVFSIDTVSKSDELSFWEHHFLGLKPIENDYFHTSHWMIVASEFQSSLSDKRSVLEYLNRVGVYFKETYDFDVHIFKKLCFSNLNGLDGDNLGELFEQKRQDYQTQYAIDLPDAFPVSKQAVKEKLKIFRQKLNLDKNFKIEVHNTRADLIESGFDEKTGKKYYKLFCDSEQ